MSHRIYSIDDLLYLMSRLRNPQTGCPWDLQQDFRSLVPYVLEEAFEVADTIERNDLDHFAEELGDLLFQVVFHSRLADEQRLFDFGDVVHNVTAKLVVRHPHVFPDGTLESERAQEEVISDGEINNIWEQKKQAERIEKGYQSRLADIPAAFPALIRAQKIQKRAAKSGFDWPEIHGVIDKVREELIELEAELAQRDPQRIEDEIGDLFFSLVNLSRHLKIDAESSLRGATRKFEKRFAAMEELIDKSGSEFDQLSPVELDHFWRQAKRIEG